MPKSRYEAILHALDNASGVHVPRHWSTWRHVIAAGIEAGLNYEEPITPRCPGCNTLVKEGVEKWDAWSPDSPVRVTWT